MPLEVARAGMPGCAGRRGRSPAPGRAPPSIRYHVCDLEADALVERATGVGGDEDEGPAPGRLGGVDHRLR